MAFAASSSNKSMSAPSNPDQEWRQTSENEFEREAVGGERMFDFLERNNNGHGEGCLSVTCTLKGRVDRMEMMNRLKNGYLSTYIHHPLIGCELVTELRDGQGPDEETNRVTYLRYRKPYREDEARQLVESHLLVVDLQTPTNLPHYVLNRRIGDGDRRRGTMYVAFSPDLRTLAITFHLSHIVYDPFYGTQAFNDLLTYIGTARADKVDYTLATAPISAAELHRRLPTSLAFAYQRQFTPSDENKQTGLDHWSNLLMDSASKESLLIPSDGDAALRKHNRRSARVTLSAEQTQALIKYCKSLGIPLVCVMGAAYLSILAEEYAPQDGSEPAEGIKVTVPLPVQQWIDVKPTEHHGPISCALMAGLVYVPIRDASIIEIAVSLGQAMQGQLADGPHPVGREAQEALLLPYLNSVASSSSVYLPPGFPGVTFIGNVSRYIARLHQRDASFEMHIDDVYMGTRTMTNRPWMLGSIWDGRLTGEVYFDEKYLDAVRMTSVVKRTMDALLSVVPQEESEADLRQSRL